jgi:hypothetical protein
MVKILKPVKKSSSLSARAGKVEVAVRLNTVWKWWGRRRVRLCKKSAAESMEVRLVPYDDLPETEQEKV